MESLNYLSEKQYLPGYSSMKSGKLTNSLCHNISEVCKFQFWCLPASLCTISSRDEASSEDPRQIIVW